MAYWKIVDGTCPCTGFHTSGCECGCCEAFGPVPHKPRKNNAGTKYVLPSQDEADLTDEAIQVELAKPEWTKKFI